MAFAAALVLVLAVLSVVFVSKPASSSLSADLRHTGPVTFRFRERLTATTSPTCGCRGHTPTGGWRGVVVPAQELRIERHGANRVTQYDIFSANPAPWHSLGQLGDRGIRLERYLIDIPRGEVLSKRLAIGLVLTRHPQQRILADFVMLSTPGPMHVMSLGREPVAAIGTPAGVPVTIDFDEPIVRPVDRTLRVKVPYDPRAWTREEPERSGDGVPMVDVVGPQVLMWAPTTGTRHWFSRVTHVTPPIDITEDKQEVHLHYKGQLTEEPPDRARLPGLVTWQVLYVPGGTFATRLVPGLTGPDGEPRQPYEQPAERGSLDVSVPRALSHARSLLPVFREARRHPIVRVDRIEFMTAKSLVDRFTADVPRRFRTWFPLTDRFQLPPTPPVNGVNVFGAVSRMAMREARGSLTIGADRTVALDAYTPLELRDITGRGVIGRRLLVPIRLDADTAQVRVQGRATAFINEEPVNERRSWIVTALSADRVTLFATLAGLFLAVGAFESGRRLRRADGRR